MVSVGMFFNTKDIRLLNFTDLPEIPSLFDESNYHLRMSLIFMNQFVKIVQTTPSTSGVMSIFLILGIGRGF